MYKISNSQIHGVGVIATSDIPIGTFVGTIGTWEEPNGIKQIQETFGKYLNHSENPNGEGVLEGNELFFVSNKLIKKEEELTVNYRNLAWWILWPEQMDFGNSPSPDSTFNFPSMIEEN